MPSLAQDLEMLRQLNENRFRVKDLRAQALRPLKEIKNIDRAKNLRAQGVHLPKEIKDSEVRIVSHKAGGDKADIEFKKWIVSNDKVEIALLVKIQTHRDISENEEENDRPRKSTELENRLTDIKYKDLIQLPREDEEDAGGPPAQGDGADDRDPPIIPVLEAARVMQALVGRAQTVFEPTTMCCYYRIIRELYGVAQPNWTVGAARAGVGGTTSAFVTNECIRAIFSFQNALKRTYEFLEQTRIFYEHFSALKHMLEKWGIGDHEHPLYIWANKSVAAMWLSCYIATNPRNHEIALFHKDDDSGRNSLLLPDEDSPADLDNTQKYFDSLPGNLEKAVGQLFRNVAKVYNEIFVYRRDQEDPGTKHPIDMERAGEGVFEFDAHVLTDKEEVRTNKFNRTATAHLFALKAIEDAVINAHALKQVFKPGGAGGEPAGGTEKILKDLAEQFYAITRRVHRVLEPSKQYLKLVINRELAASDATFDAGELVFAATSYGAINGWRLDEKLNRACERLVNSLPDNGRLPTKRPFHADARGYRTLPIGCEMTRALATLLQKTGYDFDAALVGRMLGVFEDNQIELKESRAKDKVIAWNFEGAPNPDKPAVWVTAISVLALDRIVRMLNTRINEIVLAHFDVTMPERPHTQLELHDLIYSDYALAEWKFGGDQRSTAISLQKMRAHVMRATLPVGYQKHRKTFSTIFYGPPGTGKTTLAESLALSARAPLVRLSPSDLILQGQELIEGRARDVFEALSMLTQCVVIFDEFEPVLKCRGKDKPLSQKDEQNRREYELERIADVLQVFGEKDDPKFRFVLGGMLPKFSKLYDAAETQSFVYCLGTNYLSSIDEAAKRPGRFDTRIPVYKPDVLSRAGMLLYRLSRTGDFDHLSGQMAERFIDVVAITTDGDANLINKLFKIGKGEAGDRVAENVLRYILHQEAKLPEELSKEEPSVKAEKVQDELTRAGHIDDEERKERQWLINYEKSFLEPRGEISGTMGGPEIVERLAQHLRPPGTETAGK